MIADMWNALFTSSATEGLPNHAELEAAHAAWAGVVVSIVAAIGAIWAVVYAGRGYREQARAAESQSRSLDLQREAFEAEMRWRAEALASEARAAAKLVGFDVSTRPDVLDFDEDGARSLTDGMYEFEATHSVLKITVRNDSQVRLEHTRLSFPWDVVWQSGGRYPAHTDWSFSAIYLDGLHPGAERSVQVAVEDNGRLAALAPGVVSSEIHLAWRDNRDFEWDRVGADVSPYFAPDHLDKN